MSGNDSKFGSLLWTTKRIAIPLDPSQFDLDTSKILKPVSSRIQDTLECMYLHNTPMPENPENFSEMVRQAQRRVETTAHVAKVVIVHPDDLDDLLQRITNNGFAYRREYYGDGCERYVIYSRSLFSPLKHATVYLSSRAPRGEMFMFDDPAESR